MSSKFESNTEEGENLRSQALDQFREWITKHPKIKKCKTDDKFLLRFLRTKKFSVPGACELLENYLTLRKTLSHSFNNLDIERSEFQTILDFNGGFILKETDLKGRLVFYVDLGKLDMIKFSAVDFMRIANLFFESISLDERSQINGIVQVLNCNGLRLSSLIIWTPTTIKEFAQCWQQAFPIRYQKIYFVNVPSFAKSLLQVFLSFLSEKIRSRLSIVNGWDEVFEELGSSIFPKDIGGKAFSTELQEYTKKFVTQCREEVLDLISDIDIEVSDTKVNFGNSYDADLDAAIIANGWDEVFEELGSSIFPEEIGGKVPISELGEYTKKFVTQCREEVLDLISDIDIEVSDTKVNFGNSYDADLDAAIVGSFRKISVD
uniref:Uncharacterized protein n=1 Tax=Phlebotomus papatasi TaxID=29031 RepID=A0A1B0D3E4_PHLPP